MARHVFWCDEKGNNWKDHGDISGLPRLPAHKNMTNEEVEQDLIEALMVTVPEGSGIRCEIREVPDSAKGAPSTHSTAARGGE